MAIEQKFIDLIHADIDGEIMSSDKAELAALLESNAEARALHAELAALCSALDDVDSVDPPPHLRHTIMNSVSQGPEEAPKPRFLDTLFAAPALRYAAVFAAGVFVTISIVNSGQISERAFDDMTPLVGTVADPVNARLESTAMVNETSVAGQVSLRSAGPLLILDFDLSSREPVDIEASYTDKTIWFNGFAQLESSGTAISAEAGKVRLGMDGKRRYAVYLHNQGGRGTTVQLRFIANGEVIHETSLDYSPDR